MPYASDRSRLVALEQFVRRLYVADCLRSNDPMMRLEEHKVFAVELAEKLLDSGIKVAGGEHAKDDIETAVCISALLGPIADEVRSSHMRSNSQ